MKMLIRILVPSVLLTLVVVSGCGPRQAVPPVQSDAEAAEHVIEHRVLPGETLRQVADNYYGDPGRASGIARDNGIGDQDMVAEGSVLLLRFGPAQWEDARRRAAALESYNRGVDLLGQDRLAEAEKQFQLALRTAPGLLAARYNLALVHLRRGRNDQALQLLEELTRSRPDNPDFRFARGNALFQLTRFDEAVDQFSLVLDRNPDHSRAAFGLARSLQAAGRDNEARRAWARYLELDSTSSWAEIARRNYRKLRDGNGG